MAACRAWSSWGSQAPPLCPGQRAGGLSGVGQQCAQVGPDQLVELGGGDVAGGAALSLRGAQGVGAAAAQVVAVALGDLTAGAGQPARAAADQRAQQVLVAGVAGRALLVGVELGLDLGEGLLADDGRDRDRDPVLLRPRGVALARPGRQHRRLAAAGRRHLGAVGQRPAGVGRVAQDAPDAGHVPARPAHRGGHPQIGQPPGQPVDGGPGFEVPVEQLRDQRRLPRVHPHRVGPAGPLGVQPVPERRRGPRQQRARPQLRLPAAAHPLGDQRPLVLRDRPPDLQQQLIVRISAHRPVQELHLAAMPGQLLDQQHLVDVVAGQPVRRGHQDHVQLGQRRVIAEPVQPRPADTGTAIAVIAVDVLVIQLPAALPGRRAQPVKLLLDALRLSLAGSRDPRIRCHSHQRPPQLSASGRAARPALPDAPAAGRPDPTGARRLGAGCTGGTRSRSGSSGSPTSATSV